MTGDLPLPVWQGDLTKRAARAQHSTARGLRPAVLPFPAQGSRWPALLWGALAHLNPGRWGAGPDAGVWLGETAKGREHGSRGQSLPVCRWLPRRVQAAAARASSPPGARAASHPGPHWLPSSPTRHYDIRRNDDIINFFNDFSDHLAEEALWELSLKIKPRNITRRKTDREEKT